MIDHSDVYALPGADSIIDFVNPSTGLTNVNGNTEAEVIARNPGAVRMPWEEWRKAAAARQDTPIAWEPSTRAKYWEMLECVPPLDWNRGAFLVGEPYDHSFATGAPRYQAYACIGRDDDSGRYIVSSRPLTRAELRAELAAGRVR